MIGCSRICPVLRDVATHKSLCTHASAGLGTGADTNGWTEVIALGGVALRGRYGGLGREHVALTEATTKGVHFDLALLREAARVLEIAGDGEAPAVELVLMSACGGKVVNDGLHAGD
jgi:hypothetical protein